MSQARRPHASEEGPTLLFQRNLAAFDQRCDGCPFRPVPVDIPRPRARPASAVLPVPPLVGPGATPPAGPVLARPASSGPHPAALPRPSLLVDPRGSGTLVLPDALKPAGPDAATIARPLDPALAAAHARSARSSDPGRADHDELASPDITIMQIPAGPRPAQPRPRQVRRVPDARAYFVLNVCLGVLIVAGLAVLVTRASPPAQEPAPGADHDRR